MVDYNIYRRYIDDIKSYAKDNGLSDSETNEIFSRVFQELEKNVFQRWKILFTVFKIFFCFILSLLLGLIVLYNHPSTHNLFLRNMQHYIYPGLNIFRKVALPIISTYPRLTEYYDEWCLVENPNFYVSDMDCWPCSVIQSVTDGTGWVLNKNFNIGTPFIRSDNNSRVYYSTLSEIYNEKENKNIFNEDASRISSNNPIFKVIGDVFERKLDENPTKDRTSFILWRITRMKPWRILRKIFPKPFGVPNWWGQSTEKFVFIDESKAPAYELPNPECSSVVLQCTSGSRLIKMLPSPECRQRCKLTAVTLSAGQSLWYNWWYWRPMSLPVINSSEISINYLTSFC